MQHGTCTATAVGNQVCSSTISCSFHTYTSACCLPQLQHAISMLTVLALKPCHSSSHKKKDRLNCLPTIKLPCSALMCCSNAVRVCPGLPAIPPNAISNWNASCTNLTAGSNCTLSCAADSTGIGYTALCLNGNWTVTGACACKCAAATAQRCSTPHSLPWNGTRVTQQLCLTPGCATAMTATL
jgi:hypothetical protein